MTRRRTTLAWLAWAATVPVSGCAHAGAYEDFFKAIELDKGAAISDLLKRGFDPNARDPKGQPALVAALREDSRKAAAALIGARGLKVEERNAKDESALMLAALRGNLPAARALIKLDADLNKTGWTPLHYAASGATQDAKAMGAVLPQDLVQEGAAPPRQPVLGRRALDFARRAGRAAMVELIAQAVRRRQPSAGKW